MKKFLALAALSMFFFFVGWYSHAGNISIDTKSKSANAHM